MSRRAGSAVTGAKSSAWSGDRRRPHAPDAVDSPGARQFRADADHLSRRAWAREETLDGVTDRPANQHPMLVRSVYRYLVERDAFGTTPRRAPSPPTAPSEGSVGVRDDGRRQFGDPTTRDRAPERASRSGDELYGTSAERAPAVLRLWSIETTHRSYCDDDIEHLGDAAGNALGG